MKPFARIILVSSLAREGRDLATKNAKDAKEGKRL